MGKTFVTFVLTSLLWIAVIFIGADLMHDKIVEEVKDEIISEMVEAFKQLKENEKELGEEVKPVQKSTPAVSNSVAKQAKPKPKSKPKPQPTVEAKSVAETSVAAEAKSVAEAPKTKSSDLSTAIIGYWKAVEGNKKDLEITKYGTVIQWQKMQYVELDERFDYTIENGMCIIDHPIWDKLSYRAVITSDGTNTWLEMYGDAHFAGMYKKIK